MNKDNQVWMLFACCVPVKGHKRSIIYDLQRSMYFFIPNALYKLIKEYEGQPLPVAKAAYNHEHDEIIEEYIHFLFQNELAFYTDTPDDFPKISGEWRSPYHITNAIIDSQADSGHPYGDIINQLSELGCGYIQCRFYDAVSVTTFEEILQAAQTSRLRSVELVFPYNEAITEEILETLISENKRLSSIVIHSAPRTVRRLKTHLNAAVIYITDVINSAAHCGYISASHFRTNIEAFTEAQLHNSCLNRKVGIDVSGEIKNCPSAVNSFGNIRTTSLGEVVENPDFRKLWTISKDQVDVCRDCEFRYMCMDCRIFINDAENIYSKPSRCTYDPYTATWANEEHNPQSKLFKKLDLTAPIS